MQNEQVLLKNENCELKKKMKTKNVIFLIIFKNRKEHKNLVTI